MFTTFNCLLFATVYRVNVGVNIAEKFTIETYTATCAVAGGVNIGYRAVFTMFT